jgi:hypothetical protein
MLGKEVVCRSVRGSSGGKSFVLLKLDSVDEVGKVCAIIDKEGREIVADEVLVTAGTIDLGCKAMSISSTLAASVACNNYREACENLADGTVSQPTR